MRILLLWSIITASCLASTVRQQIIINKPGIPPFYADLLAEVIEAKSDEFKVPSNVIAAIMFVESSYDQYAYNTKTKDFGLMQVSMFHVRKKKLNKRRLLIDIEYNVHHGVKIFSWFYRRYKLDHAIMRYNQGTRKNAIKSKNSKKYLRLVKNAL